MENDDRVVDVGILDQIGELIEQMHLAHRMNDEARFEAFHKAAGDLVDGLIYPDNESE